MTWCDTSGASGIVFGTRDRNVGRAAARAAARIVAALARAAEARGISWTTIPDSNLLRLGTGRHAKLVRGSESSDTSLLVMNLARKKSVTNAMFTAAGIPVPSQKTVRSVRAASRRRVARVTGDGRTSVRELVEKVNAHPLRRPMPLGRVAARMPIALDRAAIRHLARQGHGPDSVPAKGEVVELNAVSNVSRGSDAIDVTDEVHADVRRVAERAAQTLGLDYLTDDISRPPR